MTVVTKTQKMARTFDFSHYIDISTALRNAVVLVNIPALGYVMTGLLRILSDIRVDLVQLTEAIKYNLPRRMVIKFVTTFF